MECKDEIQKQRSSGFPVLIETYWNVKVVEPPPTFVGISINRNILECKAFKGEKMAKVTFVLIETYWNVKAEFSKIIYHSVSRINRNILECKEAQKNRDWQAQQSY